MRLVSNESHCLGAPAQRLAPSAWALVRLLPALYRELRT